MWLHLQSSTPHLSVHLSNHPVSNLLCPVQTCRRTSMLEISSSNTWTKIVHKLRCHFSVEVFTDQCVWIKAHQESSSKILISPFDNQPFYVFCISILVAWWPRVFRILSGFTVNYSEQHDQSHFGDLVCGSGLHGRQNTLMLSARTPVLTISMQAVSGNLICGLPLDLHLGIWHILSGEC